MWSSKQVQISPETNNETQPKTTLHVPGQLWFFVRVFSIWLNGWRFSANSSASSWQPACRSASYIYRRACCISFSVWCVSGDSVVSWWSVGDVLVISLYCAGASRWRLGEHACVMLCLRGILLVLWWHFSGTFGGVRVVSCLWVSWWWWHGMWALIWVDISMVCCIYARRHNTQYQTIQHACGPWLLQRFSSPYRRSLHKEKTVCAACDQVNKYKSHPKQTMKHNQKRLCMFQGNCDFSCAFFLFDWMVEDFLQILPHPLGRRRVAVQVTPIRL